MINIQYIKVPFILAFDIDAYSEALALGIAPSGSYIEIPFALESFVSYPVGFRNSYSGSGYWLRSGSSVDLSVRLEERFLYPSGYYDGNFLASGTMYRIFAITGLTTGSTVLMQKYLNDNFANYFSGFYTGNQLTGATIAPNIFSSNGNIYSY